MKEIYLDAAATTKVRPEVAKAVADSYEIYGNPSSLHRLGREAREKLEECRKKVADFIGAESEEIIFTSGGSESNNFALKGLAAANPHKKHILISAIEHPSVIESARALERSGFEVEETSVDEEGILDLSDLEKKIRKDTLVVSVMHVNNEVGTIQPVEAVGEICRKKEVYFHCDAVQSFWKLDTKVDEMNVDLMSVSGHKIGAPRGVGFLYVRLGTRIKSFVDGGGQEMKLRSGTENLSGVVGFVKAMEIPAKDVSEIRDFMLEEILKIPGARLNGSRERRIYNNINVSFYGIEGESLMMMLDEEEIFVSTGSACASSKLSESHVLKAMKVPDLYIQGSVRLSLWEDIDMEKAEFVVAKIREKVEKLSAMSPFKLNSEDENGK